MEEADARQSITFTFPQGSQWHNLKEDFLKQGNPLRGLKILTEPQQRNSKKQAHFTVKTLSGVNLPHSLKITGEGYFQCMVNGERRKYPLPLEIKNTDEVPAIFVHESPEQYAIDSAIAETGTTAAHQMEAVQALATIILARTKDKRYLKHRDCHFCDLTCCQVYAGLTRGIPFHGGQIENPKEMALFFHASNGGKIFTPSVFNSGAAVKPKPAEYSYNDRQSLSQKLHQNWSCSMNLEEINSILNLNHGQLVSLNYSPSSEQIFLFFQQGKVTMAPETFRLKINRRKGWNFLKSNNYSLTREGERVVFTGSGLGHGVGLSMDGAIELAEMGYSRNEILEHYFPGIKLSRPRGKGFPGQFVLLNASGDILEVTKSMSFLNRRIPPGSVFKVVTSLYLALHRPDILDRYSFHCPGKWQTSGEVITCWESRGHGETRFNRALSSSCNLFFASLVNEIDQRAFFRFLKRLEEHYEIAFEVSRGYDRAGFAKLLCGLDFEVKVRVQSLVRLTVLLKNLSLGKAEGFLKGLGGDDMDKIMTALRHTFISGTASLELQKDLPGERFWGKTGTVMTGTNQHISYGIFMGGYEDLSMVSIMPRSHGEVCARNSLRVMRNRKNVMLPKTEENPY